MYKKISVMFAISVLTGCAGMNSDFENATPAKDSGYWLQQAEDMTSNNGNTDKIGSVGGRVDVKHYRLLNVRNIRLPLKYITSTQFNNFNNLDDGKNDIEPKFSSSSSDLTNSKTDIGYPFRTGENVGRVWFAPYVSPDDNAHLGELVYFVTKKTQWDALEPIKGGK